MEDFAERASREVLPSHRIGTQAACNRHLEMAEIRRGDGTSTRSRILNTCGNGGLKFVPCLQAAE